LERCFHSGLVLGFNEVISILQQQHDAFQIGRRELRLDETEPERDLRYASPLAAGLKHLELPVELSR
jgi:hypothetical protein